MSTRSPEQYFQEQSFSTESPSNGSFSEAERAFLDKYLGIGAGDVLRSIGIEDVREGAATSFEKALPSAQAESTPDVAPRLSPVEQPAAPAQPERESAPASQAKPGSSAAIVAETAPSTQPCAPQSGSRPQDAPDQEPSLTDMLRRESELLMVGFFLGDQEFVVPTQAVQEVIRYMTPTKLPAAPPSIAGVINLRGRVTPLIRLRELLEVRKADGDKDVFTIVCRRGGLQFGLMIEKVHTMYRVRQQEIDWGVEAHFGANVDYVSGLLKLGDNLVGIVSVDRILETIIRN